jgi:DNA-binding NarL/FixJ family response regulator
LFAARRLDAEGVALIFAAREPFTAPGVAELPVRGLDAFLGQVKLLPQAPPDPPCPRRPRPACRPDSPQELQIVRLAAQGLSNRDIAQLFLSPRTVGYHLYKTYPELGVASRGELGTVALSD